MPLVVQILLCLCLLALICGVVWALLWFPRRETSVPTAPRERLRSLSGLLAVVVGDASIVLITLWCVTQIEKLESAESVALVAGGFTAVSTLTTAYLGIKAVSNTASNLNRNQVKDDLAAEAEAVRQVKAREAETDPGPGDGQRVRRFRGEATTFKPERRRRRNRTA
ncbi:hypothetical protein [Streptomyces sp. NPDC020141]|uniref:hypothetical protein n=1 Tax=Streptomyces sp. NPDC020141 TaxID=3365065 RepID=UPI00378D4AF1